MGPFHISLDQMGLDQMGLDQMGLDQMGLENAPKSLDELRLPSKLV